MMNQPFIYGKRHQVSLPLEKYQPGYRSGIVKTWLDQVSPSSKLVIFPFGGSPLAILEAASSGYQCLAPIYNPISRFLINQLTQPIPKDKFNSALVRLASSYKGKERLKPFLLSLYETDCPICGTRVSAKSFTWSRATKEPIKKTCPCPNCSEYTVGDLNQEDRDKALFYQENSPTHARALTRVAAPNDPIRVQVENALQAYPPRSLYALFTVLNKLTGFEFEHDERVVLETLLLHAFSRCSSVNFSADADTYQEENVWYMLEETPEIWATGNRPIPVSNWPDIPPESGGISVFPGRMKDLSAHLPGIEIGAVWMVFPRPTLSFWALSALWTGWLWGQEAASPLHNILSLRDYGWAWLTRAVENTLSDIWENLPDRTPCFGLIPELEIDSIISSITAASSAGFLLENISLDPDLGQGQTIWTAAEPGEIEVHPDKIREIIRSAGLNLLDLTGEPKDTITLYSAAMAALSTGHLLPQFHEGSLADPYNNLIKNFEENIAYRQGFLYYPKSDTWWHQELTLIPEPDADQIEQSLVEFLVEKAAVTPEIEIYSHLYRAFPGIRTPRSGLINVCLGSYAVQNQDGWKLKDSDQPNQRRQDLKEIEKILSVLGNQLAYDVEVQSPIGNIIHLIWQEKGSTRYTFYISASSMLSKIISQASHTPTNSWIIIPGSRADLIHHKLNYNPPLASALEEGWDLIKYRHIRRLNEEGGLTRENLQERLKLDPFISDSPQLQLI